MIFYFFVVALLAVTASQGYVIHEEPINRYPHTSLISWPDHNIHQWHDSIWDDFEDNWPLLGYDLFSPGLLTYQRPTCYHHTPQGDEVTHDRQRNSDDQSIQLERQRLERIYQDSVEKSKHVQAEMEEIKSQMERLRQPAMDEDKRGRCGNNEQLRFDESRYRQENRPPNQPQRQEFNVDEPSQFQSRRTNVQHQAEHFGQRTRQQPDINHQRQDFGHQSHVDREPHRQQDHQEDSRMDRDHRLNENRRQGHDQSFNHQNGRSVNRRNEPQRQESDVHRQNQKQFDNRHQRTEPKVNGRYEQQYAEPDERSRLEQLGREQLGREQRQHESRRDQGQRQRGEADASSGRQRNEERPKKIPKSKDVEQIQNVMMIPMRGFQPRDLKISHHGDSIRIHASRTCKGRENCVSKEMDISYPLPYRIKAGTMKASVDGSNIVIKGIPVRTELLEVPTEKGREFNDNDFDDFVNKDNFHFSVSPHEHSQERREITDNFLESDSDVMVEVED